MAAINITEKQLDILVNGNIEDSFTQRANSADYDISLSNQGTIQFSGSDSGDTGDSFHNVNVTLWSPPSVDVTTGSNASSSFNTTGSYNNLELELDYNALDEAGDADDSWQLEQDGTVIASGTDQVDRVDTFTGADIGSTFVLKLDGDFNWSYDFVTTLRSTVDVTGVTQS